MIDLDEQRDFLKIPSDEHGDDEVIEALIAEAVGIVETGTGYSYGVAGSVVEYLKGMGTDELFLSYNPTADPTQILEIPEPGDVGTVITAAQSDGWLRRGSRLVRKAGSVWTKDYEYAVTHVGGYAAGAEPPEVRNAVKRIVAVLYRQRGKEDTASTSIGGYSETKASVQEILDGLSRRGVFA